MIDEIHLPNLDNEDLRVVQSKPRRVPDNMPRLSFLAAIVGSRGCGKTNAMVNLVRKYDATKSFDKLYMMSPTANNDPKYKLLDNDRAHYKLKTYTQYTDEDMQAIVDELRADIEEYKRYEADKVVWDRFVRAKKPDGLSMDDYAVLERLGWEAPKTEWKMGMPTSLLIFDDLVGSKLYRADCKGPANAFFILHRHLLCSVVFLSQVHRNAVPKQLRSNLSMIMFFRCRDRKLHEAVSEEFSAYVSPEELCELWDHATREPHGFLMGDFDTRDPTRRFHAGFNRLLVLRGAEKVGASENTTPK